MQGLQLSPSRTVVTSFTPRKPHLEQGGSAFSPIEQCPYEEGDWVLHVAAAAGTIATALSNGEIQVYDQQRMIPVASIQALQPQHCQLQNQQYSQNKPNMITDLVYGPQHTVVAATTAPEKSVVAFDLRQNNNPKHHQAQPALTIASNLPIRQEKALSISLGYDGQVAAVGSNKARIHFLDLRASSSSSSSNIVGSYVDAHTDEVTTVRFQPSSSSSTLLLTGSEDGLACVFDTTQATESAALQSVLSVGTAVRRAGFCGNAWDMVYCLTGSETASLWQAETGVCVNDFGGWNIRQNLSQSTSTGTGNQLMVDYLVDVHWDTVQQELLMVAGDHQGNAGLFQFGTNANSKHWQPCHMLTGGHRGVVRAWCPLTVSTFATVGEDARMCEWNRMGKQTHAAAAATTTSPRRASLCSDSSNSSSNSWQNHPVSLSSPSTAAATKYGGGPLRRQRRVKPTTGAPY